MPNKIIKLLVYSSDGEQRRRLLNAVNEYTPHFIMETFGDLRSLDYRLRHEFAQDIWLVLITVTYKELDQLINMNELIRRNRNILVLPNQNPETVAAGHSLYPRLISYLESDYSDIGSVLGKVVQKNN